MCWAADALRWIAGIVLSLVLVAAGCLSVASTADSAVPPRHVHASIYDVDVNPATATHNTTERGPPAARECVTSDDAIDRRSNGPSVRLEPAAYVASTIYSTTVTPTHVPRATGTASGQVEALDGDRLSLRQAGVAAKSGALTERAIGTTMDDVLQGASFYRQSKATQYLKPGGFSKANADFDALAQGVTVIERGGGLRTATLSNGTNINVRPFSSGKYVTLEVATPGNPVLKIRYEP